MKNKKTIIVSLYSLLLLFILVVSYGFITTTILGNNNSILNVFKSNPFTIVYTDSTNVISGDASDSFSPGSTITKSFTITNPKDSTLSFSIYLDNVTNTFTRKNDITYTLSLNGNDLKTGVFPSSKETIIYGQSIEPNETLNYTLTINYLNSEENQIVDSGAVIGAKLEFGFSEGFDNILVYGNSVQNGTPSLQNPIDITYVGDKTNNLFDAEKLYPNNTYTDNGVTLTRSGQGFYLNGERTDKTKVYDAYSNEMTLPAGSYTFTVRNTGNFDGTIAMYIYSRENGYDRTLLATSVIGKINSNYYNLYTQRFTLEETTKIRFRSFLNYNSNTVYNNNYFVAQLVEGTYGNNTMINYEPYGYRVPITIGNTTTNVYLNEPLRKVEDYVDYIDIKNKKVVRNVEHIELAVSDMNNNNENYPGWKSIDETSKLKVLFPNVNTALKLLTARNANIGKTYNILLNTNGVGVLFFSTAYEGILPQADFITTYPNLVYKLDYGLPNSEEENIDVPDISTVKYSDNVSVGTTLQPSNLVANHG